jgi:hypothetical protein
MKSLIRGIIVRVSSLVTVPSAAAATAPVALGRWGIQYDEKVIDRKIIQANEDHCGCCVDVVVGDGVAVKKKEPEAEVKKNSRVVRYEQKEEYLLPYVM